MQPNKSVEEIIKEFNKKFNIFYVKDKGFAFLSVEISDFIRQALTSHTNTVLQGVVERVDETIRKTENTEIGIETTKVEYKDGYLDAKNDIRIAVSSLLNDQIISNEEKYDQQ